MIRMSAAEMAGLFDRSEIKMPGLRENDIQRHVMQFLRMKGWFVVKIHQSLGSHKGIRKDVLSDLEPSSVLCCGSSSGAV